MPKTLLRLAFLLLITIFTLPAAAHADWGNEFAQAKCDEKGGTFTIAPYWVTSNGPDVVREGFTTYETMGDDTIRCKFGKYTLAVNFGLSSPSTERCSASGSVGIHSVSLGNVELLKEGFGFYRLCPLDYYTTELSVHFTDGRATLTECKVDHDTPDDKLPVCTTTAFDIDKLSAEYTRIDNNLADPATQAAQAAVKLPTENDMAAVFKALEGADGLPDCAHWSTSATWSGEHFGRVAGEVGDRIYLHQGYPGLCRRNDDDACRTVGYVIPGDRVQVDGICGAWSHITYVPRLLSKPRSRGWIKTAQLYAVDPIKTIDGSRVTADDAIWQAVAKHDLNTLRTFLTTGDDETKVNTGARALRFAAGMGDVKIVEALLEIGAKPNAVDPMRNLEKSTALMAAADNNAKISYDQTPDAPHRPVSDAAGVIKRLIAAGADVNVRDREGWTALFRAVDANNVWAVTALLAGGADPAIVAGPEDDQTILLNQAVADYQGTFDPTIIRLLLEHGVDPNRLPVDHSKPKYSGEPDDGCYSTSTGCTVLMFAADIGSVTVTRLLLDHGADPTITSDGISAVDIAKDAKFAKIAALIQQAADQWKLKHGQH